MIMAHAPFNTITFEEIEPGIAVVRLNRPERLNALNLAMLDDFSLLCTRLSTDKSVRVLILTGQGKGFCSGADLMDAATAMKSEHFPDPETFLNSVQERYGDLIRSLREIPQPVIAAVNGAAAGGGFCMALASDIRIATPNAYFVASFINIGLSGGELGSSYLLPRLIGLSHTADILYTGRKVYAEEAEKMGLVSAVVPFEELLETALKYARMMTAKSPGGLKLTKRALDRNIDAPSLGAAIDLENRNQTLLIFSGEFAKLVRSFSEKG
jgi:enoyl-CoA hydratase/carnithine racemase